MKFSTNKIIGALVVALMSLTGMPGAIASTDSGELDIAKPLEVMQRITPSLASQTDEDRTNLTEQDVKLKRSAENNSRKAGKSIDSTTFTPQPNSKSNKEIAIKPKNAKNLHSVSEGIAVLDSVEEDVKYYVQPLDGGLRFMTAIASSNAPNSYSYDVDLPDNASVEVLATGEVRAVDVSGVEIGVFQKPWAIDAKGSSLPTHYEWNDGVLTQKIEFQESTVYPVLADPAWWYQLTYELGTKGTIPQVYSGLTNCFNCLFPISGAPVAFPQPGQHLPLTVGGYPFPCTFAYSYMDMKYLYFEFTAEPGHIDGAGSSIGFGFWKPTATDIYGYSYPDPNSMMTLNVSAMIMADMGPLNDINFLKAEKTWLEFAGAMRVHLGNYIIGNAKEKYWFYLNP